MKIVRPTAKPRIFTEAVNLAKSKGLRHFSRDEVAAASKVASATVSFHFGGMAELRREIVRHAIENEIVTILADARSDRSSADLYTRMSSVLKQKVAAFIAA